MIRVFIPDPDSDFLPIPDPGSRDKKAPDPGSVSATPNFRSRCDSLLAESLDPDPDHI